MFWQRAPRLLAVLTALAMAVSGSSPASAADLPGGSSPDCWVQDTSTGVVGADLRVAIRDADVGVLLRVRGTCTGGFQVNRDLTLSSTSVRGNVAEDGGGGIYNEGRVIMNWSSSVSDNEVLFGEGGGISNPGTVVLNRAATVTANQAEASGGVFNDGGAVRFSPRRKGTLCGNTPDDWPTC